jgi:hypothetical protein
MTEAELRALTEWALMEDVLAPGAMIAKAGCYEDRLVRTSRGSRIAERVCKQTVQLGSLPTGYAIPR